FGTGRFSDREKSPFIAPRRAAAEAGIRAGRPIPRNRLRPNEPLADPAGLEYRSTSNEMRGDRREGGRRNASARREQPPHIGGGL
ncbi:MAG: hypothetical protein ABUL54_12750, partial [Dongia sp.]